MFDVKWDWMQDVFSIPCAGAENWLDKADDFVFPLFLFEELTTELESPIK